MNMMSSYNFTKISLKDDYEGKVIATLISAKGNTAKQKTVLYLHGFSDYFFHPFLGQWFNGLNYDFYALDLRKYGRSIQAHQHPNYCKNMEEYFEELDLVIQKLYTESGKKVILFGHSTGGLTAALYTNYGKKKDLIDKLILNSPFLEINEPLLIRKFIIPAVSSLSLIFPYAGIPAIVTKWYPMSLHKAHYGEWEFDDDKKPVVSFPGYFAWLKAIQKGQKYLKKKSNIEIPVSLMYSSKSVKACKKWKDDYLKSDIILNVKHIKKIGSKLGTNVSSIEIKNGMHDILLSGKETREMGFNKITNWLKH